MENPEVPNIPKLSSECCVREDGGICERLEELGLDGSRGRGGLRVADPNRRRSIKKESKLGHVYLQVFQRGKLRDRKLEEERKKKLSYLSVSVHPLYTRGAVPGRPLDLPDVPIPLACDCDFGHDIITYMHSYQFHHPISLTPLHRGMLVRFIYEKFNVRYPTEVYYIAVNLVDIAMAESESIHSTYDLELCGVTAVIIAAKLEAHYHYPESTYPAADLCRMEIEILTACNWQITRNTVMHFMRLLQHPISLESGFWRLAKELSMLTLVQNELAGLKPSLLGAVVMRLTAWVYSNRRDSWPAELYVFCQHDEREFDLPTRFLVTLCRHAYQNVDHIKTTYPMVTPTVLKRVCNSEQVTDILSVNGLVMM